jgi:3-isopropylmalate dehydrogenase
LYANICPTNFASNSPQKESITKGVDIIIIRKLIGSVYFGACKEQGVSPQENVPWDMMIYSVEEVQRIMRVVAQITLAADPPLPIHSIDKANVLASSRLWRKVVTETPLSLSSHRHRGRGRDLPHEQLLEVAIIIRT